MKDKFVKILDAENKVFGSAPMKKLTGLFSGPKGFFAVLLLIAAVYAWKADLHPGIHSDEAGLISIPYRAVAYDDYNYPLIFSDSYNAGPVRHYPPIMAAMLRAFWHEAVGFSDYSSRLFSGLMMAILSGLFGMLVYRRTQDWRMAAAALVCTGLNPAVVVAARTVRFEQEIVFMGGLAFLLPLLLAKNWAPWISRLVWIASGLCAAWAGFSHPWGMVFPFVLVMTFLFTPSRWKEEDGLGWFSRLFFFGLGCLLPFVATVLQAARDWPAFLDYIKAVGGFYTLRQGLTVEYFLNRYNIPLEPGLLGGIVARILQLHMTGYGATATKLAGIDVLPIGFLFQIVFWGFVTSLFMWKCNKDKPFYVRLWVWLGAAFVVFGLLYVPNQVYALYGGLFVVTGALLLRASSDCPWLSAGVRVYTALCVFFALSYLVFLGVSPKVAESVPLDERHRAFAEVNEAAGITDGDTVFVDTSTWYAGGKNAKSYSDIIRTGRLLPSKAFIVNGETFNGQVKMLGNEAAKGQPEGKTWRETLGRELAHKVLRSAILIEKMNTGFYYLMPTNVENPILLTFYGKDGQKRQFRGSYGDMVPMRQNLAPRWYLLMTPPSAPANFDFLKNEPQVTLHYARTGDFMISAALIEVRDHTTLKEADPRIILVPLLDGWKAR